MIETTGIEDDILRKLIDKLYNGNRGADCPSDATKIIRLLTELESFRYKPTEGNEK